MAELRRIDSELWREHEPMDWQHWVSKLPEGGDGIFYTRQEWRAWVDMMYHVHKTMEPIPAWLNKKRKKKTFSKDVSPQVVSPQTPALYTPTPAQGPPALSKDIAPQTPPYAPPTPAQGPPAQGHGARDDSPISIRSHELAHETISEGEASCTGSAGWLAPRLAPTSDRLIALALSFGQPAKEEPALRATCKAMAPTSSGHTPSKKFVIKLEGQNAKEKKHYRSLMRAFMWHNNRDRQACVRFSTKLVHAPPICNRVNSGWKEDAIECHCKEWPHFLNSNLDKTHLARTATGCVDSDGVYKDVEIGQYICYWRPGKQGKKWWFNGKVESLQSVQLPSGRRAIVMGVN